MSPAAAFSCAARVSIGTTASIATANMNNERFSRVEETAARAIERAARSQMIVYSKLGPKVWTSVVDQGVQLTLRYLCEPRQRRNTAEVLWEDILTEFGNANDIDFAYPTIRRYINADEGKPGTGGPSPPEASVPASRRDAVPDGVS